MSNTFDPQATNGYQSNSGLTTPARLSESPLVGNFPLHPGEVYISGQSKQSVNKGSGKALTYDQDKPPLAVLPWGAIRALAKVQAYGHKKYHDFNNYRKGMEVSRNLSCALRHIADYMDGQDFDPESGINPLAHALCRIAFVLQNLEDGTALDDRYKKPAGDPTK